MKDIWKHVALTLAALLIGAGATSFVHNGRLTAIEESVQDIRERVVRIETKLEALASADQTPQVSRWIQVGR